jgi:hypothetical protein
MFQILDAAPLKALLSAAASQAGRAIGDCELGFHNGSDCSF